MSGLDNRRAGRDFIRDPSGSERGLTAGRKTLAFALGLLLASSIAACTTVGPEYQAPVTALEPFHSEGAVAARPAAGPPLDSWWTGFDDPVLTRIVERTLAQNLDLAAALAGLLLIFRPKSSSLAAILPLAVSALVGFPLALMLQDRKSVV